MIFPKEINCFRDQWLCFSNFYPAPVRLNFDPVQIHGDDFVYDSVEHAFQAAKGTSLKIRERFTYPELSAYQAKQMGRKIDCRLDWRSIRVDVMRNLVRQKFQPSILSRKIMGSFTAELIEGNWWHDDFWGVCYGEFMGKSCKYAPHQPLGENWLGKILMEVRQEKIAT